MSSITTTVARQYRLQEWASQIRECQRRPQNLTVKDWCIQHQNILLFMIDIICKYKVKGNG